MLGSLSGTLRVLTTHVPRCRRQTGKTFHGEMSTRHDMSVSFFQGTFVEWILNRGTQEETHCSGTPISRFPYLTARSLFEGVPKAMKLDFSCPQELCLLESPFWLVLRWDLHKNNRGRRKQLPKKKKNISRKNEALVPAPMARCLRSGAGGSVGIHPFECGQRAGQARCGSKGTPRSAPAFSRVWLNIKELGLRRC